MKINVKGSVPQVVAEGGMSGTVESVREAFQHFRRDEEIDMLERSEFIVKMDSTPPHTNKERRLLMKSLQNADYRLIGGRVEKNNSINDTISVGRTLREEQNWQWKRILSGGKNSDFTTKRFTKFKKGDPIIWGKVAATIHASSREVFAWMWFYCSNHRMEVHRKKEGNMVRQLYEPPTNTTNDEEQNYMRYAVVHKAMSTGFYTREFNQKYFLGSFTDDDNDNEILIFGFVPAEEENRFIAPTRQTKRKASYLASNKNSAAVAPLGVAEEKDVQVLATGIWIVRSIATDVCEVTFVNRIKDTGKIPTKIFNTQVGRSLNAIYGLKSYFERNGLVVDKEVRDVFVANIPKAVVSSQVSEIVEELSSVNFNEDSWEPLPKDSNAFAKLNRIHIEGESNAWGKGETIIDASAEEVLAYFWDYCR